MKWPRRRQRGRSVEVDRLLGGEPTSLDHHRRAAGEDEAEQNHGPFRKRRDGSGGGGELHLEHGYRAVRPTFRAETEVCSAAGQGHSRAVGVNGIGLITDRSEVVSERDARCAKRRAHQRARTIAAIAAVDGIAEVGLYRRRIKTNLLAVHSGADVGRAANEGGSRPARHLDRAGSSHAVPRPATNRLRDDSGRVAIYRDRDDGIRSDGSAVHTGLYTVYDHAVGRRRR